MEMFKEILPKLDRSKNESVFQYLSTRIAASEILKNMKKAVFY